MYERHTRESAGLTWILQKPRGSLICLATKDCTSVHAHPSVPLAMYSSRARDANGTRGNRRLWTCDAIIWQRFCHGWVA